MDGTRESYKYDFMMHYVVNYDRSTIIISVTLLRITLAVQLCITYLYVLCLCVCMCISRLGMIINNVTKCTVHTVHLNNVITLRCYLITMLLLSLRDINKT